MNPVKSFVEGIANLRNSWDSIRDTYKSKRRKRPSFITAWADAGRYSGYQYPLFGVQERAIQNSWLYTGLQIISREIVSAEFQVVEYHGPDEQPTQIPNHPLERILRHPNPFFGRAYLWWYTTWWLYLHGNAYWFVLLNDKGQPAEIWPLPARDVEPYPPDQFSTQYEQEEVESQSFIEYYEYTVQGKVYRIPAKYIVHFQFPNPFDPFRGLSPLSAAVLPVDSDLAMSQWNAKFFGKDNTMPNAIINLSTGDPNILIDKSDVEELREDLRSDYRAFDRKTAITSVYKIETELLGYNPRDLDFIQGRELAQKEIFNILGVPTGILDAANSQIIFGNTTMAERMLKGSIWGVLTLMAEQISVELVHPYYGRKYDAKFEDIRPTNRDAQLNEVNAAGTFLTIDEIRKDYFQKDELPNKRGEYLSSDQPPQPPTEPDFRGNGEFQQRQPQFQEKEEEITSEFSYPSHLKEVNGKSLNLLPILDSLGKQIGYVYTGKEDVLTVPDLHEDLYKGAEDELKQWYTKSRNAIKRGEPAQVPFLAEKIPDALVIEVQRRLFYCDDSRDAVKIIFGEAYEALPEAKSLRDKWRPWANRVAKLRKDVSRALSRTGRIIRKKVQQEGSAAAQEGSLWASHRQQLAKETGETLGKLVDDAITRIERDNPDITNWEENRRRAAEWASRHAAQRVTRVTDTARREVQEKISEWALAPTTREELAKDLAKIVDNEHKGRMIAETEATDMFAESTAQALEAIGVGAIVVKPSAHILCRCFILPQRLPGKIQVAVWYTFGDERVCTETEIDVPWQNQPMLGCKSMHNIVVSGGPFLGMKTDKAASEARTYARRGRAQALMQRFKSEETETQTS